MATFARLDGILHCENVSLEAIAATYGTPTYLYLAQRSKRRSETINRRYPISPTSFATQ